jgi:hypothetical protein
VSFIGMSWGECAEFNRRDHMNDLSCWRHHCESRRGAALALRWIPVAHPTPPDSRSYAMLNRRLTLIGFALAMAAGTAVAATAPAPAATSGKAQAAAPKEKQTCVKHNKMGHCEKWAPAKAEKSKTEKAKTDTAAKAKESK